VEREKFLGYFNLIKILLMMKIILIEINFSWIQNCFKESRWRDSTK